MGEENNLEECAGTYRQLVQARKEINVRIERLKTLLKDHAQRREETKVGKFVIVYKEWDAEKLWNKADFQKKYGDEWVAKHKTYELRTRINVKEADD